MSDATDTKPAPELSRGPSESMSRRIVRGSGWALIGFGVFLLGFVGHQLFVTTWFAQQHNTKLEAEANEYFAEADIAEIVYVSPGSPQVVDPEGTTTSDPDDPPPDEPQTLLVEQAPPAGQAFAIIRIPTIERLQEGWTVVEGVTRSDLKAGAGHMPTTPLPGQPGNAVIAGHRTTYGAPFHEFDELVPNDLIEVETALGVHTYAVRETIIVKPTEIWVAQHCDGAWLTLTTCHPKFSSRQRLVVFAELVDGPNAGVIVG